VTEKSTYRWRIYVDRPVSLYADVSYSFQGEQGKGTLSVTSRAGSLKAKIQPGRLFVGEPNSNWQIDSFDSHRLGQLEFTQAGYYDISLEIAPRKGEEVDFQWLWLGTE
jgi:alpha-L-fucosidase